MSSPNGNGGDSFTARFAAEAGDELARLLAREEEIKGQLQLAAEERRRIQGALKQLDPEHPLVQAGHPRSTRKSRTPAPATTKQVWEWIMVRPEQAGAFTIRQIAHDLNVRDDGIRRAVYALRDAEALRAAGQATGANGHRAMQFRVLDAEAGNRLLEVLNG